MRHDKDIIKKFEQFAKHSLNLDLYQNPKYANEVTENAWVAWLKGTKFKNLKEGRIAREERETFFGNNIRAAIKEFKEFLRR